MCRCISHIQNRSLVGTILMSAADLGPPTYYIPMFYQKSTFIVLKQDATVSTCINKNSNVWSCIVMHHFLLYKILLQPDNVCFSRMHACSSPWLICTSWQYWNICCVKSNLCLIFFLYIPKSPRYLMLLWKLFSWSLYMHIFMHSNQPNHTAVWINYHTQSRVSAFVHWTTGRSASHSAACGYCSWPQKDWGACWG